MLWRYVLTLALVCCVSITTPSRADTTTSAGEGGGESGGPFAGLLQAPEANLFTGGLSQEIPIRIPPGRKMATPDLKVIYSSDGGSGFFGEGWAMPLGSIERSEKWGVPRCTGIPGFDKTDEFVLSIGGSSAELVNFGSGPGGSTVYRPRTDASFLEALRKSDNSWEVFDRSGMRYKFGTTAASRRTRSISCGFTAVWGLTQITDPNGNTADFSYFSAQDMLVLDKVQYGGSGANHAFQVRFEYVQQPAPFLPPSWRNGVYTLVTVLVDKIHIEAKTSEGGSFGSVRVYDFEYDHELGTPPAGCNAPDRVLLCNVAVSDGMPTQSFEYSSGTFGLSATTESQGSPGGVHHHLRNANSDSDVEASVMDMNGDGRLDFVKASDGGPPTYTIYYGLAQGGISTTVSTHWCASGATIDSDKLREEVDNEHDARTVKETVDLTGDGLPDYVDSSFAVGTTNWKVYPGSKSVSCPGYGGTIPGFVSTPIDWAAPEPGSTYTWIDQDGKLLKTWKRLADMNGDGRPDLVISDWSEPVWMVYLNTGSGFAATGTDTSYGDGATGVPISWQQKVDGVWRTTRDLFDFNGDGLPDLVTAPGFPYTCCQVHLNNGQWFEAPISVVATDVIRSVTDGDTFQDFLDVNGDGLPDRVRLHSDAHWRVSINRGTSLAPEQDWGILGVIRRRSNKANTKIDMVDWNHDGMLDRVDADVGGNWSIRLGQPTSGPAIRPYLMTAARNGVGGVFYPTYQPSTRFENTLLPFPTWVVTETRRTDGLCSGTAGVCLDAGHEIQRTYSYADGYFDGSSREFRGFGEVTESYVHSSSVAPTSRRTVHFSQDDHTRGQIEKEETIGGGDTPIRTETFTWFTQSDGPRTQVFLYEKKTEEFDAAGGSEPPLCRLDRNHPPDVFGRVSTRCTAPCGGEIRDSVRSSGRGRSLPRLSGRTRPSRRARTPRFASGPLP